MMEFWSGKAKSHGTGPSRMSFCSNQTGSPETPWKFKFLRGGIGLVFPRFFSPSLFNSCNKWHKSCKLIFNIRFPTRSTCQLFQRSKVLFLLFFFPFSGNFFPNFCQFSTLSPFFQNASLASRAPVVSFALLFSKAALYDEPESSQGALETN